MKPIATTPGTRALSHCGGAELAQHQSNGRSPACQVHTANKVVIAATSTSFKRVPSRVTDILREIGRVNRGFRASESFASYPDYPIPRHCRCGSCLRPEEFDA